MDSGSVEINADEIAMRFQFSHVFSDMDSLDDLKESVDNYVPEFQFSHVFSDMDRMPDKAFYMNPFTGAFQFSHVFSDMDSPGIHNKRESSGTKRV